MAFVRLRRLGGRVSGPPVLELDPDEMVEVTLEPEQQPPAGPGPTPAAGLPPGQLVRLVAVTVTIVLVGLVAFGTFRTATGPSIASLRRDAGWDDLTTLNVGVNGDVPGLSECAGSTDCTGFDADIARLVGDWLGVLRQNVRFYQVYPEDRHRMVGYPFGGPQSQQVDVDLMVAAYSITPERERQEHVVFAGPYLVTETTVLTRLDHARVESLSDLARPIPDGRGGARKQRVCVPGTTTSAQYLAAATGGAADVTPVLRNSECVQAVRRGTEDAAVTDAAILAGFADRYSGELRLNNISNEQDEHWGIALGIDTTGDNRRIEARKQLVLLALTDLYDQTGQESWRQAYRNDLAGLRTDSQRLPGDADHGQAVAQDLQPQPERPAKVYRWPWERNGAGTVGAG